jgi:hypothetical protein
MLQRFRVLLLVLVCSLLLASSGVVVVLSTNQVSNTPGSNYRWEPTAASGTTWTHGWYDYAYGTSVVSTWNGSSWLSQQYRLTTPGGVGLDDLNLNWDSSRSRFVFAALDLQSAPNVWYGYSNSAGTIWTVNSIVLPGNFSTAGWDYPSIGVDASGRIVIGAVSFTTSSPNGYYTTFSTDGATFSPPALVTLGSGPGFGARSRVVATNNILHAFVPTLNSNFQPTAINRWQSSDGRTWTGPNSVATFSAPSNNSPPGTTQIFYATLLAAQGYTSGLWSVAFQINNAGFNNVEICTSNRGCGIVNPYGTDEFLAGTSVSGDGGYWVSYYAYSSAPRTLPLITQAIYFPPGKAGIGATTNTGIDPTSWFLTGASRARCPNNPCYAAGDFQTVASNPYAGASTPFVKQSSHINDLFQSFVQDPQGPATDQTFVPNTIWVPLGSDVSYLGAGSGPEQPGLAPILTIGAPGAR